MHWFSLTQSPFSVDQFAIIDLQLGDPLTGTLWAVRQGLVASQSNVTFTGGDTNNNLILDPGETWEFTLDPEPARQGLVTNTASFTVEQSLDFLLTPEADDDANYIGSPAPNPGIDLTKFVNGEDRNDPNDPLQVTEGDPIIYSYTLENTGNVAITDIELVDDNGTLGTADDLSFSWRFSGGRAGGFGIFFDPAGSGDDNNNGVLDVGETWNLVTTANAFNRDAMVGLVTNIAEVNIFEDGSATTPIDTDTDTASYEGSPAPNPDIDLTKFVNGEDRNNSNDPLQVTIGDAINYTYTVENTGNVAFSEVQLIDDNGTPGGGANASDDLGINVTNGSVSFQQGISFVGGDSNGDFVLDPGETWQFAADPQTAQSGLVTNLAEVGGSAGPGSTVTGDNDTASYEGSPATGSITVVKDDLTDSGTNFTIFNALSAGVFLSDDGTDTNNSREFTDVTPGNYNFRESLAAAALEGFTLENIVIEGDLDGGSVIDLANGSIDVDLDAGEDITVTFVNNVVANPGIDLTKFVNGEDRNDPNDPLAVTVGDAINYTYTVTNNGNVALRSLLLVDDNGTPNDSSDDLTYGTTAGGGFDQANGIDYQGNVIPGDTNQDFILDPGETWEFSAATQSARIGAIENTVTAQVDEDDNLFLANGQPDIQPPVATDTDTANYIGTVAANPSIDLEKAVNGVDADTAAEAIQVTEGDAITYTYELTNDGTVDFSIIEVVDDFGTTDQSDDLFFEYDPAAFSDPANVSGLGIVYVSGDSNNDGILNPNETWSLQSEDPISALPQLVTNEAVVRVEDDPTVGTPLATDTDTANYEGSPVVPPNPDVSFEKQVNGQDADTTNDLLQVTVGDAITYTYEVTNTGNTDLTQISLVDDNATPGDTSDDQSIDVNNGAVTSNGITLTNNGNGDGTLAPGETWVFTLDAGAAQSGIFQNTATLTTGPDVLQRTDTATYLGQIPVDPNLTIDLEKFVNGQDADTAADAVVVAPGAPITYTYTLTNTSAVAYRSVSLQDDNGTIGFLGNDFVYQSFQPVSGPLQTDIQGVQLVSESGISNNILDPGETWTFRSDTQPAVSGLFTNLAVAEVHRTENLINSAVVGEAEDFDLGNYRGDDTVQPPTTGTITVVKDADVKDGTDFNFSGDLGNFTLDDANPDDGDNISNTATFSNQAPGSYSVEELAAAGFDLSNIQIQGDTDGGSVIDLANNTIDIDLDAGEDITVTFENTQQVVTPNPSISFNKLINGVEGPLNLDVGDPVNYTYEVTNDGNVNIRQVRLRDNNATPLDNSDDLTWTNRNANGLTRIQDGDGDNLLEPGETWIFEADAQLAEDGTFTNRAVIRGRTPDGTVLREVDTATYTGTEPVDPTGNITVVKDADVKDGTDFNFSGDLGSFVLDDANPDDNDGVSNTATFNDITAGSYSVEELAAAGFDLNNIQISGDDDNGSVIDVANGTVDIDLDAGEDITVTFNNTQQVVTPTTGNITVVKDADVADGTNFHFSGDLSRFSLDDAHPDDNDGVSDTQIFSNVTAGSYSVTEGNDPNFDLSNIVINGDTDGGSVIDIDNGTVDIDLDPGENITVTFENNKRVEPDNEITGTTGMDMLHGTDGRDIITGLEGMDMMSGGAGNDDFVFNNINEGLDYISDFQSGADRLILNSKITEVNNITV